MTICANESKEKEKENEERNAKPSNLEKPDPLLNALDKDKVDLILQDDKKNPLGSTKILETHYKTSDGDMKIEGYRIPVREKKVHGLNCSF